MPRVIDATPTWAAVLPILIEALRQGDAQGRRAACEELSRMAQAADAWNAHCKAQARRAMEGA